MKRLLWLLAVPYMVFIVFQDTRTNHYACSKVPREICEGVAPDCYYAKDICDDYAEALNAAHERRMGNGHDRWVNPTDGACWQATKWEPCK